LALALTLLPLPTLALALFYALLILLALVDPVFDLYCAILSVPMQQLVHLPCGISYTQGAMLLALGAWRCTYWRTPSNQFSTITCLPPTARRTQMDRSNLPLIQMLRTLGDLCSSSGSAAYSQLEAGVAQFVRQHVRFCHRIDE
jgi:hypothetical protein